MSRLTIVNTFLPNKSLTLNLPEEFLKDQYSTDQSRNMEFDGETLQSRLGLTKFDSNAVNAYSDYDNTYTKVCSHFDGADEAVAYTDPIAGAYTFAGTAQLDTAQKKFGTASLLLDGNSDYVTLPDSADWDFAASNFTIDFWVRFNDLSSVQGLCSHAITAGDNLGWWLYWLHTDNTIHFVWTTGGAIGTGAEKVFSWTPGVDTWYHFALVRSGNDLKLYINGTQTGATGDVTGVTIADVTALLYAGFDNYDTAYLNGWLEEVRVSKGIARWTADFTPETSAYPSVTEDPVPFLHIDKFDLFSGTWHLMFCTTTDIMKYDFSELRFDYLTPVYATGTITIATGSRNIVTGSGTTWSTNISEGDFFKINTGNYHSGAEWFKVDSIDSDTQITLTTYAPITAAGTGYGIRQCFAGSATDAWHSRVFQDTSLGDVWIATNGVDTPVRYTGTGQCQALASLPTSFVSAKYVEVFKDRVIFLWCVLGSNEPQREYWSAVANCESWDDLDFHDFMEGGHWIKGTTTYDDYHIVFREKDAQIGRWVGGDYVFDYEKSSTCIGCKSAKSIIKTEQEIYYYGFDNNFHAWNSLRDKTIGDSIFPILAETDPNLEQLIYGWRVSDKDQIRWFIPYTDVDYNNLCVVYDYAEDIIQLWDYQSSQALSCIGDYLESDDLYLDNTVWGEYYLDEVEGFFDSRSFISNSETILYGGYDGYLRKADLGSDDDGTTFSRVFESVRMNFGLPQTKKRLWKQQYWLESNVSGDITISVKKDDNNDYELSSNTISLADSTRDVIKKNITWNKEAENFKIKITATNYFGILGFISYLFEKGSTIR